MKMLNRVCAVAFALATLSMSVTALAQVGDQFPDLSGLKVNGKEVTLPADGAGKYTLIGMAYSKKSEDDLKSWYGPVYNKFVHKAEGGGLFDSFGYDVNVYFVPMFTGIKSAAEPAARKKALKKMDPRLHDNVLFYRGKLKPYKDKLDFEKKDIPYFFVLDPNGKIVHATSGAFSDRKLDRVEEAIDE